ncbi:MAG: enoyl-CoA hydratase-related protein [Sulfolobaceae archaeon]
MKTIIINKEQPLIWIILNRPKVNAINLEMIEEIYEALKSIEEDNDIRVVILRGNNTFSAGADINLFKELNPITAWKFAKRGRELMDYIENYPKPTIAMIEGYALGGGLELAMACDLRYSTEDAILGLPEIDLGIYPGFGGTQRLVKLIGKGKALELMMTGARISGKEAERIGLVNKALPKNSLEDEVRKVALMLAEKPPIALYLIKYLVNMGDNLNRESALRSESISWGLVFSTQDKNEGVNSFFEKRKPKFKGL